MSNDSPLALRVGRITTRLFPDVGGPAKHAFKLTESLGTLGVQHVVLSGRPSRLISETIPRAEILRLPSNTAPRGNQLKRLIFTVSYFVLSLVVALFMFSRRKIDLVHAHSPWLSGLVGLIVGRLLRVPVVYTVHGLERWSSSTKPSDENTPKFVLEEWVTAKSDSVITITSRYRDFLETTYGHPSVYSIGNGVDTKKFVPADSLHEKIEMRKGLGLDVDKVLVLYVGNFYLPEKVAGIQDLLASVAKMSSHHLLEICILLAGDGPFRDELERTVHQLGLQDYVTFLGHRRDVKELMKCCDLFVLPSRNEGSPNALLEAMSSGLPCIATRVGGVPDIVGDSGILVDPSDVRALATALEEIITDTSLRQRLGSDARSRAVNSLSWRNIAHLTLKVYIDVTRTVA